MVYRTVSTNTHEMVKHVSCVTLCVHQCQIMQLPIHLFIYYFNIFIQNKTFSKAVFNLVLCDYMYNIYNTINITKLKQIYHTH